MRWYRELYITPLFFAVGAVAVLLFVMAVIWPPTSFLAVALLTALLIFTAIDMLMLFRTDFPKPVRFCAERFSMGDPNPVRITLTNTAGFSSLVRVTDEAPLEFQMRDLNLSERLEPGETKTFTYEITPHNRGLYNFGACHAIFQSPIGLVRRIVTAGAKEAGSGSIKVYPSFHHLQTYELMARAGRSYDSGSYQVRTEALALEFDQIRDYTQGDEVRAINWAASARVNKLMVNQFMEERAQPVYSVIDTGRVMEMPFGGMSLLDYSINASLGLSRAILAKSDKPGLITFSDSVSAMIPASNRTGQQQKLIEALCGISTDYNESSFEGLYTTIRRTISTRSTLLLFTNLETMHSLNRTMPVLRKLNKHHLLVVILFRNTELQEFSKRQTQKLSDMYDNALTEEALLTKEEMIRSLRKSGIRAVLANPEHLSVQVINTYLMLKRQRAA